MPCLRRPCRARLRVAVRRLATLAQALSRDGLKANARKDAYRKLFAKLDGLMAQHKEKVAAASKGILQGRRRDPRRADRRW